MLGALSTMVCVMPVNSVAKALNRGLSVGRTNVSYSSTIRALWLPLRPLLLLLLLPPPPPPPLLYRARSASALHNQRITRVLEIGN